MPRLVKSFPVVGRVTVNVDDDTAQRLTSEEGWQPAEQTKTSTSRRKADDSQK